MRVEITDELEAALVRRGLIASICCVCSEWLGTRRAQGARGGVSGGLCKTCLELRYGLGDDHKVSEDLPIQFADRRPRDRSFVEGVLVTGAIIACALSVLGLAYWVMP